MKEVLKMAGESNFQAAQLLVQLGNSVTWLRNIKMQAIGMTSSQSEVIRYIFKNYRNCSITASSLTERLRLSQSTVAGILKRLESKGFIERIVDDSDSRKYTIIPTAKGLDLENQLKQTAVENEKILLRGMNKDEQKEFKRLLQISMNNMNEFRSKKRIGI